MNIIYWAIIFKRRRWWWWKWLTCVLDLSLKFILFCYFEKLKINLLWQMRNKKETQQYWCGLSFVSWMKVRASFFIMSELVQIVEGRNLSRFFLFLSRVLTWRSFILSAKQKVYFWIFLRYCKSKLSWHKMWNWK